MNTNTSITEDIECEKLIDQPAFRQQQPTAVLNTFRRTSTKLASTPKRFAVACTISVGTGPQHRRDESNRETIIEVDHNLRTTGSRFLDGGQRRLVRPVRKACQGI